MKTHEIFTIEENINNILQYGFHIKNLNTMFKYTNIIDHDNIEEKITLLNINLEKIIEETVLLNNDNILLLLTENYNLLKCLKKQCDLNYKKTKENNDDFLYKLTGEYENILSDIKIKFIEYLLLNYTKK